MNDHELITRISSFLGDEDLMGIGKSIHSPKDEFSSEAKQIVDTLRQCDDVDAFTEKLILIFNESFEPVPPYDFDNIHVLAQQIYKLCKN